MHLNDDRIQRLIDGESSAADQHAARAHVAECASCRERLGAARDDAAEVATLLMALDGPAPAIAFADVEALARTRRRSPWTRGAIGWVAAAVLAVAAYAAPGSPVSGWVGDAMRWVTGASHPATAPAPAREPDSAAGIAVDPGASFVIAIEDPAADGVVVVRWTDDAQVSVRASGGAAFTSSTDRLEVAIDRDSVTLEIAVPRHAPRVEIRAGDRTLWLAQDGRVSGSSTPEPDGTWRIAIDPR